MSLEDSVDLVLHAFAHARQGDIFVQKAPAATIAVLAESIQALFRQKNGIRIIGTRHGEKLYESLVSREELARAENKGRYYRVPADTRDLNYAKFFVEGETEIAGSDDYTSHNTRRLNVDEVKKLLLKLDQVREYLNAQYPNAEFLNA
jgi:UDP-glucose 4-epimerase